jgi:hypothetical protein
MPNPPPYHDPEFNFKDKQIAEMKKELYELK